VSQAGADMSTLQPIRRDVDASLGDVARASVESFGAARRRLEGGDALLRSVDVKSLAPETSRPTSLVDLGRQCLVADPGLATAFAEGLCAIAEAQVTHFPDNIFADFDHMAHSLLSELPAGAAAGAHHIRSKCALIVHLYQRYGRHSPIRFRYVHDFVYGYDWAKWVNKAPQERAGIGAFDMAFLTHMARRADELHELIAVDDTKYPALPDGRYRNPFSFNREPAHEVALLIDLARAALLPIEAWRADGRPRWDLAFAELRVEKARRLGIPNHLG
jgi:hypothetical protein